MTGIIRETRLLETWTSLSEDGLVGWVPSTEAAESIRESYEFETGMKYVTEWKTGPWRSADGNDNTDLVAVKKKSKGSKSKAKEEESGDDQTENHMEGQTEGETANPGQVLGKDDTDLVIVLKVGSKSKSKAKEEGQVKEEGSEGNQTEIIWKVKQKVKHIQVNWSSVRY